MRKTIIICTTFILIASLTVACSVLLNGSNNNICYGYEITGDCTKEAIDKAIERIIQINGGVLKLKKNGVYRIRPVSEHVFILPSHIKIEGNGARIIIEDAVNTKDFTWDAVFYSEGKSDITIENVILEANGNRNPVLQKSVPNGATRHNGLLSALRTNNITIKKCTVKDVKGFGCLYFGYCNNVIVEDCHFYDIGVKHSTSFIGDASVLMGVGKNWLIQRNEMHNDYLSDCGTGLDLACSHSTIKNNIIESFWAGANLTNNGLDNSCNVVLEDNEFINNATAIYLWATIKPFVGSCFDNIIRNNHIRWTTRSTWGVRGIDLGCFVYGDVYNITINNNEFVAQAIDAPNESYEIAIRIGPTEKTYSGLNNSGGRVHDVEIYDNTISGCTGPAVQIERVSHNITVRNNTIKDVSLGNASYTTNSAIVLGGYSNEVGPRDITIKENLFSGNNMRDSNKVYVGTSNERRKKSNIIIK